MGLETEARFNNKEDVERLLSTEEGCRLEGFMTVNKIAGNIHLGKWTNVFFNANFRFL